MGSKALQVRNHLNGESWVIGGNFTMYAVMETGGKQYKVAVGDTLFIERLDNVADDKITFDKVILVSASGGVNVGAPYVAGATVSAKVLKNGKAKKIIVFKMKPKKGYRRKQGHRQPYTQIEITGINA